MNKLFTATILLALAGQSFAQQPTLAPPPRPSLEFATAGEQREYLAERAAHPERAFEYTDQRTGERVKAWRLGDEQPVEHTAEYAQASTVWFTYSPPGSVDGKGILAEVLSRCDEAGRRRAYEPDRVTYCHELTHQLNSRIRNSMGGTGKVNAFYVGGGQAAVFHEPRVTLSTVAQYVDPKYRNDAYKVHFTGMASNWNNEPLYVLDEWSAYINGSLASRELKLDPHGTYERAIWFCHYADCLLAAIKAHDPNYRELADLTAFVDWQKQRTKQIAGEQQQVYYRLEPVVHPLTVDMTR